MYIQNYLPFHDIYNLWTGCQPRASNLHGGCTNRLGVSWYHGSKWKVVMVHFYANAFMVHLLPSIDIFIHYDVTDVYRYKLLLGHLTSDFGGVFTVISPWPRNFKISNCDLAAILRRHEMAVKIAVKIAATVNRPLYMHLQVYCWFSIVTNFQ